ncbi:PEGA domain-containing protein [Deinococcus geothermalis]|uniref:PEGA domain-containing protein n=1 Tax=Deinococcus geothermalis TaxID=68909 RepID=UPI002355E4FF
MKSIGPYVAARDLTGDRPAGAVRTLRATDRLTGIPVLLHVLPHAVPLPELPQDPALLLPSEGGIDGDTAYVVTELPPHALPATDPVLAARGGLAALAALHGAGLTHGGVDAAQLWSVDGRVALAGAGLPWGGEATPAGDLRDLLRTLETLGGVPPALRDVPDEATARDLLARLDVPVQEPEKGRAAPDWAAASASPLPTSLVAIASSAEPVRTDSADEQAPAPQASEAEPPSKAAEVAPLPPTARSIPTERVPARRVAGDPVRITWDANGTRRVIKSGRDEVPRRPGWRRPVLTLFLLLLIVLLLFAGWRAWRSSTVPVSASASQTPSAACCDVRFTVQGTPAAPVRLSLVSAPAGVKVDPDRVVGQAPGTVRLPQPGTYTLRVAAEGYTPGMVTVKVPSAVPVQITLTP